MNSIENTDTNTSTNEQNTNPQTQIQNQTQIRRNFKGIWIPRDIYLNNDLSWTEKILLIEIDSLDDEINGCFATNEYFIKFLNVSERSVSSAIKRLKELGYIELTSFNNKRRVLKIIKSKLNTSNNNLTNTTLQNKSINSDTENTSSAMVEKEQAENTSMVEENFHPRWKKTSTPGGRKLLPSNIYINNTLNKTLNRGNFTKNRSYNSTITQNADFNKEELDEEKVNSFETTSLSFEDDNSEINKYIEAEFKRYYSEDVYNSWIKDHIKIVKTNINNTGNSNNNSNTNNNNNNKECLEKYQTQNSTILLASDNNYAIEYIKLHYFYGFKKRRGITSDLEEDTYWVRKGIREFFKEYDPNIKEVLLKPIKEIEQEQNKQKENHIENNQQENQSDLTKQQNEAHND